MKELFSLLTAYGCHGIVTHLCIFDTDEDEAIAVLEEAACIEEEDTAFTAADEDEASPSLARLVSDTCRAITSLLPLRPRAASPAPPAAATAAVELTAAAATPADL